MATQNSKNKNQYTGMERAAIMMLSLTEDQAQKIFNILNPEEIKDLSQAMIGLGAVSSQVVEALCMDFVNEMASSGSLIGSVESTERLLLSVLPIEQAEKIMEEIRGPAGRNLWDKLGNVNEELLANYLKNEYPQTVAVVLSKIRPDSAASVLSNLPDALADEVIMRMIKMEQVRKDIIDDIEHTLRKEFMNNLTRSAKNDNYAMVAEMFNNLDRNSETRLLSTIESKNPETAEKIRSLMFTFEDVSEMSNQSIQMLMKNIDRSKLALSLKGVPERIKIRFIKNMSERASKLLRDDMENMGLVRIKEVEMAQNEIVAVVKDMAARNEISLSDSRETGEQLVG